MADSNITKRALAQNMKELMAEKPFNKISVGDICERCGMNRKSFYYHFQDKYDLVNWIFYTEFISNVRLEEQSSAWGLLDDICTYFYRERQFYRSALQIQGQNSFREYFVQVMAPFIMRFNQRVFPAMDQETHKFAFTFLTDAFTASMVRWLSEGAKLTAKEYLDQLRDLLVALARYIMTDLNSANGSCEYSF
ncbi:MAG: TetR family transcriptional regulator [Oscillospiraceae bacterium]|nr:TetR family transcriptional regulator [Oscillospiraceae bacterium]